MAAGLCGVPSERHASVQSALTLTAGADHADTFHSPDSVLIGVGIMSAAAVQANRSHQMTETASPIASIAANKAESASSAMMTRRRVLLASTAMLLVARARECENLAGGAGLPWRPFAGDPPQAVKPGPWVFFTPEEGAAVEALVDRLIPPDPETPGGKDCGCAVFIDRQLAGAYGSAQGLYMSPPFLQATPEQGLQAPSTPAQLYRRMLAALDAVLSLDLRRQDVRAAPGQRKGPDHHRDGERFAAIARDERHAVLRVLLQDTRYGFFADPIYGGNRDMAAWKMIGFPGARYDYRDWVERHNERYPHPPISIAGTQAHRPGRNRETDSERGVRRWRQSCRQPTSSSSAWAGPARSRRIHDQSGVQCGRD